MRRGKYRGDGNSVFSGNESQRKNCTANMYMYVSEELWSLS